MSQQTKKIGVYRKFMVRRADGTDAPGGKHDGCAYFVLDLTHDPYAGPALRAYVKACRAEYPLLAADLQSLADGNPPMRPVAKDTGARPAPPHTLLREAEASRAPLPALVERWRSEAHPIISGYQQACSALERCAAELEAALRRG